MFKSLVSKMSPGTRRKWRSFFSQRRAWAGLVIIGILAFFSLTAEIWSHQNPLLLVRDVATPTGQVERKVFFPAVFRYSVAEFGIEDSFVVDFKALVEEDKAAGKDTIAFFPFNKWDPYQQTSDILVGPSADHPLGTDNLGRDVLARLVYGVRISLSFGIIFWLGITFLGVVIGATQGFYGGITDFFTERTKELLAILPVLPMVILITGLVKAQTFAVPLGILLALMWTSVAGQMRAQFLGLRRREFCEAARALGGKNRRIIFKHLLPNALTPIITLAAFEISAGIGWLTQLDFLGYGLPPPTPSIGELLQQGRENITNAPWLLLAPAGALILILVSINWIGESVRQAFDPRMG